MFLFRMSGSLEFIDTSDFTIMSQNEHFMATDIEWDPTGRYVVSGISYWMHKVCSYPVFCIKFVKNINQ